MLRTLSLCTCCRHYPGAAAGRSLRPSHPAVSAFDEPAIGSACTSSFSRIARRSLALRPAHSHRHLRDGYPRASDISSPPCLPRLLPAGAFGRVGLAPTGKRRLVTAHADYGHLMHRNPDPIPVKPPMRSKRRLQSSGAIRRINPHILEHLANLQRRAPPVSHIDEGIQEAREVLRQFGVKRLGLFRKDLDK